MVAQVYPQGKLILLERQRTSAAGVVYALVDLKVGRRTLGLSVQGSKLWHLGELV